MRRRILILLLLLSSSIIGHSQELYMFTNPASNIPAKAWVLKGMGKVIESTHHAGAEYRLSPECQLGLNKNWMLAGGLSLSDMFVRNALQFESFRAYAKYRFLSIDEVHRHFRMAVHGSYAWSRNPLQYQELNFEGDHTGFQGGIVGTGLVHKLAVSGGISFLQRMNGQEKAVVAYPLSEQALGYNLSAGYLLFPLRYKNYKQVNVNLYLELLGQKNLDIKAGFMDVAPAIQFILASRMRINAGARYQLAGSAQRMATQSAYLSVEYYFLNGF
ncbi:MAG: hypothetical protein KGP35_05800 [Bacteroidetes bacterium]|nr:hypothetical protein [Bacteroidota bacterium]